MEISNNQGYHKGHQIGKGHSQGKGHGAEKSQSQGKGHGAEKSSSHGGTEIRGAQKADVVKFVEGAKSHLENRFDHRPSSKLEFSSSAKTLIKADSKFKEVNESASREFSKPGVDPREAIKRVHQEVMQTTREIRAESKEEGKGLHDLGSRRSEEFARGREIVENKIHVAKQGLREVIKNFKWGKSGSVRDKEPTGETNVKDVTSAVLSENQFSAIKSGTSSLLQSSSLTAGSQLDTNTFKTSSLELSLKTINTVKFQAASRFSSASSSGGTAGSVQERNAIDITGSASKIDLSTLAKSFQGSTGVGFQNSKSEFVKEVSFGAQLDGRVKSMDEDPSSKEAGPAKSEKSATDKLREKQKEESISGDVEAEEFTSVAAAQQDAVEELVDMFEEFKTSGGGANLSLSDYDQVSKDTSIPREMTLDDEALDDVMVQSGQAFSELRELDGAASIKDSEHVQFDGGSITLLADDGQSSFKVNLDVDVKETIIEQRNFDQKGGASATPGVDVANQARSGQEAADKLKVEQNNSTFLNSLENEMDKTFV